MHHRGGTTSTPTSGSATASRRSPPRLTCPRYRSSSGTAVAPFAPNIRPRDRANDEAAAMNDPEAAEIAKSLGHPLRLEFIRTLRECDELSPSEFSRQTGAPTTNVSYHVAILAKSKIIEVARTIPKGGTFIHYYCFSDPRALIALRLVDLLAGS